MNSAASSSSASTADEAAVKFSPPRQQTLVTDANNSPGAMSAKDVAPASPKLSRLLDSDPNRFRSLKRVIVIGRPGSGTDGVGDALRKLGFKVYDFKAASNRYERDFPLWLEAARLRQEGRPYNKSDFDKLIGDHDAIVGAPACFFDEDFVKLYSNVKVILVTRNSNRDIVRGFLAKVTSHAWQRIDPGYFGAMNSFVKLSTQSDGYDCKNSDKVIRETVKEKNLLEIHDSIAWTPLCGFLGVEVPDAPAPELHDDAIKTELATRLKRWMLEVAVTAGNSALMGMTSFLTIATVTLVSALAVFLGGLGLYTLPSSSLQLFKILRELSQLRDVTRFVAVGGASCMLFIGFIAGYCLALMRKSEPVEVTTETPRREHQSRTTHSRKKGRQGRGRHTESEENARPERPALEGWGGVQDAIRRNDAELREEGRATLEEWKNGKHVTFHVTHKRTVTGQDLFSGPRKVLSVSEETV
ncbi:hypothetical protein C7974DRAFT_420988 [Boeremia exigua]|uniref:uncharacterized protein n=1 Tax=Boeremia exigua TaxID=749465 RepID=UPI001E8D02DA|nr:uncharacterized protein C7974DRAFT_420988 [Boeremia exigua]KAH6642742.1 hypothetical protein C7974DRAFT_420988 [Boeremia exigua]